jgi:hypothetical protein
VTVAESRPGTIESEDDRTCAAGAYAELEADGDVAPNAGDETVIASYADGVTVLDREGVQIASAPGYACEGSADEAETLIIGRAFGAPTIAMVVTSGGRREQMTWLAVFRVGFAGRLDPVFTGTVEERSDDRVRRGEVTFVPDGLIYRRPGSRRLTLWVFDPAARAYTQRGPSELPIDVPHAELPPR